MAVEAVARIKSHMRQARECFVHSSMVVVLAQSSDLHNTNPLVLKHQGTSLLQEKTMVQNLAPMIVRGFFRVRELLKKKKKGDLLY